MYMKEEDICREYRQAKDKQVQIGILAEQNLCSREEIAAVLARGGEEVPALEPGRPPGRKGGRRKGGHGWDTERAQALYNEGWTDKEIAKMVGVVPSTLCSWRSRQGLPPNLRPSKETKASPPAAPEKPIPSEKAGPVELSVELDGCAFALRAPDLEPAARVHAGGGKLLADMRDSFAEKKGEAR